MGRGHAMAALVHPSGGLPLADSYRAGYPEREFGQIQCSCPMKKWTPTQAKPTTDRRNTVMNAQSSRFSWLIPLISAGFAVLPITASADCPTEPLVWLNHQAVTPGIGTAISLPGPPFDVVEMSAAPPATVVLAKTLEIPPGYLIKEAILCPAAVPPEAPEVNLVQASAPIALGPVATVDFPQLSCTRYVMANGDSLIGIDPAAGPLTLTLQYAASPVPLSGIGLRLTPDPNFRGVVPPHEHVYLTGRGNGHNNTRAITRGVVTDTAGCEATPTPTTPTTPPPAGPGNGNGNGNGKGGGNGKGHGKGN